MKILIKIIDFTTLSIGILLGLTIVLKSLGASTQAPFVSWLYFTVAAPLIAPFYGIFPSPQLGTGGTVDIPAFFALVIYMACGYGISLIVESIIRSIKPIKIFNKNKTAEPNPQI